MASDKYLNCSLQRVYSFYFKSCVNRARILQLFSTMIYPGLEKSSSHERWLLVRNPKARIKHEKRTGVGEGREKQEERASGESKAEDIQSRNWKGKKTLRIVIANGRREGNKTRYSEIFY